MKIRIMGTEAECQYAQKYYASLEKEKTIVSSVTVSSIYPNRGSNTTFRVYVDITYNFNREVINDKTWITTKCTWKRKN